MRFVILVVVGCVVFNPLHSLAKEEKPYQNYTIPLKSSECVLNLTPTIDEVQRQTLRYARLRPEDLTRWKKNIKWAAALPRLQLGYERRIADGVSLDLDDSISVSGSGTVVGPTSSGWNQNLDRNHNIEVKAVWYLDELIFNREDLSIAGEARSQISARRDLLNEVNDHYFRLKELLSLSSSIAPKEKGRVRLEIEKEKGHLSALTGGWFHNTFKENTCD